MYKAVLFDLDGTLIDSGPDIAAAVNHVRAHYDLPPLDLPEVLGFVGDGAQKLLLRAFADSPQIVIDEAFEIWADFYADHCLDGTELYDGISDLLLKVQDRKLAVVSNKPVGLVSKILAGLSLQDIFPVALGGDSLPVKKPDPAPLLHAARALAASPSDCIMVGDGLPDVLAGKASGMATCAVTYGFVREEDLRGAQPDFVAHSPLEVMDLLG